MSTFILIAFVIGTFFLGKHALKEGMSIEQNKKLLENMRKHDKKSKK
jgi:hypothetical protein